MLVKRLKLCCRMHVCNYILSHFLRVAQACYSGQDVMTGEKPKDDYYREAAQFLNSGERVAAETGDSGAGTFTLAFLTRGLAFS
jgi:hypothetical protein